MSFLKTLSRRTFLVGSVSVAGGIAFGTYLYKKPYPNPLLKTLKEGEAALTPFIKITKDGITLITPRADKGQGAYSLQAYLIAEEFDVDPAKVQLTPGMPDKAYYNQAITKEASPFPAYDNSWMAQKLGDLLVAPAKFLGMQITGGSSTAPDMFTRLRIAGASARETLKAVASEHTGVPRHELKTNDGYVILPDGERLAYTELAADAADITPIQVIESELRPASEWKYIGKQVQRLDIIAKSTGTETFGIDLVRDNMVYAAVRANPGIGGQLGEYDDSRARNMRGVFNILPINSGIAVVADNTWRAFKAANAINIDWQPPSYPASSEAMWEILEKTAAGSEFDTQNRNDGDVDAALMEGTILEADYKVPYLAHAPLEPMNAIVQFNGDSVEIWTGTQIPGFIQQHVADFLSISIESVYVYVQPMGGSFGRRLEDTYVMQAVEIAKGMEGTPVKLTWSREEDFTHDYPRPMQLAKARGKIRDGKVDTYDLTITGASVVRSWAERLMGAVPPGPDVSAVAGAWDQPFAIPNYRVTGKIAPEMVPISSWRSVGASGNGFLHSCFIDELCHSADLDPMDELIRLCNHDLSRQVLQTAKEISGWAGTSIETNRGRGVAFCLSFGVPVATVVEVTNTAQGIKLDKAYVVVEVGTVLDPVNLEAQVTGGTIWGLGHAMNCELTYKNYAPEQTNFHAFSGMRMRQAPDIEVVALQNYQGVNGIGEPAVPPAAPALANAIFAATGKRIRELPLWKQIDFV